MKQKMKKGSQIKYKDNRINRFHMDNRFVMLALLGAVLAVVLIVLNTSFAEYIRLNLDGYAVENGTVTASLGKYPDDEEINKTISLSSFEAMDYVYSQGDNLYVGEKHKTQLDADYPVYVNEGTSLLLLNDGAVLYDENFVQVSTYQGMLISDGYAYNSDGEQADAANYLFLGMQNGNYVNLGDIDYIQKGTRKNITKNSFVHFGRDFFAYYELDNKELIYKSYENIAETAILTVNGESYTYKELLEALGIWQNKVEVQEAVEATETEQMENVTESTQMESDDVTVTVDTTKKDNGQADTAPVPNSNKGNNGEQNKGVRPDSIRPDKPTPDTGDTTEDPVVDYVKPVATVGDFSAGVYRITTSLSVSDPADRIDKTKQVQFEVYEVDDKGKETLKLRTYRKSTNEVEIGGGSIAPSTTYHVIAYFTYWNEYNESVVEPLTDQTITTKGVDTLGAVNLAQTPGTSYNNRVEIAGLSYAAGSDEEAVYGIDPNDGMKLEVKPANGIGTSTSLNLKSSEVSKIKRRASIDVTTMGVLKAKTTYAYEFSAKDYFGNTITLTNHTGIATTSNNAPEAKLTIEKNEIDDLELSMSVTDVDNAVAAAAGSETDCNIYLVLSSNRQYLTDTSKLNEAVYYYQLQSSDYTYSKENGLTINNLMLPAISGLALDTKYFATIYCDYDLSNGKGVQQFAPIGQLGITSAGLSSLGKVYITSEISDITSQSAFLSFKLNTTSTNAELVKLIQHMDIHVVSGTGDDAHTDTTVGFSKDDTVSDNGQEKKVYEQFQEGTMVGYTAENLTSMTEYTLDQHVYATYNGVEYELISVITNNNFKTLRKPAEVTVDNILFAAGTLAFDVKVDDPDEAITGNAGDKVVVNLYTSSGNFVKAIRIKKNEDLTITFQNLDVNQKYQVKFVAVEYNEGYTNATFESNKVLKTVDITEAMRLSGSIKLDSLTAIAGDSAHYTANARVCMQDPDHYLYGENAIPYYVRVKEDGTLIDTYTYQMTSDSIDGAYDNLYQYQVEQGEHTYQFELYVNVSNREMVLDTLEFTTETTIEGFGTAYEMIQKVKANPSGKYVAKADIVLSSKEDNYQIPGDANSAGLSGRNIVSIFYGNIDFQGFTLEHHYYASGSRIFTNMGPGSKFTNVVYKLYQENEGRIYDDGCICYRNFGTISDIMVYFEGGYTLPNQVMALLARTNASTGIIENFVIKNAPQDGYAGVSGLTSVALVTVDNFGIVRYGYVYGEDIVCTDVTALTDRRVAGIVATNQTVGRMYSVYSLVNVVSSQEYGYRYGAVCGYSNGITRRIYSIGESMPAEDKNTAAAGYQTSPTIGQTGAKRYSKVYYWNTSAKTYSGAQSKLMTIENLYDTGWQQSILTTAFDTSTVEVGYYPHVKLSGDLPSQEYIALPERSRVGAVEISQAVVQSYYTLENDVDAASVKFVFSNRENLDITGLAINGLSVTLDTEHAESADGYTTIMGEVSNPQIFASEYEITSISYIRNGKENKYNLNPVYVMAADFYRKVANADDWYNYVVLKNKSNASENVRLSADIDFAGIDAAKIMIPNTFNAKLDGNGKTISNIDLQKGFNTSNNYASRDLFNAGTSLASEGEVTNLYVKNYKCGGTYTKKGVTYVARYGALLRTVEGTVSDVHIEGIDNVSFDRMGGIAATLQNAGEISDCTVTGSDSMGVRLLYTEPKNENSNASMGGIVAWASDSRISHCLVTDLTIEANEMKGSNGIGGVTGYAVNSVIDTAYAVGEITTRGSKVGGIVGQYYATNASIACVKNIYAKVNIISYTDMVGELIGQANITSDMISETNNMTGIAFGNVYASNMDSENVSHTVGNNIGKNISYYGTQIQLINGIAGTGITDKEAAVVRGLFSYEDLTVNAVNSYRKVVGFENVYSMTGTQNGYLPKMYYEGSTRLLPDQKDIILDEGNDYNINVTNVYVNSNTRVVTVELSNPNNYKITDIGIEKLAYHYTADPSGVSDMHSSIDEASDYSNGTTRIYLKYEDVSEQEHYLDSYVLKNIKFYGVKDSDNLTVSEAERLSQTGEGVLVDLAAYARIGVTLYREIGSVSDWNQIPSYDEYENYRLIADLDFSSVSFATNLKIGRLAGMGSKTISHVNITGSSVNLISRLNSGMDSINLVDSTLSSSTNDCIGFIGISSGKISNCSFTNLTITPQTNGKNYVGIIGYQNGNRMENITLKDITVKGMNASNVSYVGSLCGYIADASQLVSVTGEGLNVEGQSNVGGICGYIYKARIDEVALSELTVTANGDNVGGLAGVIGGDGNCTTGLITNIAITGTPMTDADGVMTSSSTVIKSKGGQYTGALIGICREVTGTNNVNATDGAAVTGCQVVGFSNWIGGAYGYNYVSGNHIAVTDTLIQTAATTNVNYKGVGGVMGKQDYWTGSYYTTDNVRIEAVNHSDVGGIAGDLYNATLQYATVRDTYISAKSTIASERVGGVIGYQTYGTTKLCGTVNTIIDAPQMSAVGGVVGWLCPSNANGNSVYSCYSIAQTDESKSGTNEAATAAEQYKVYGKSNVGGIIGYQKGGYVSYCYSNMNVVADGAAGNAGGLVGYYGTEYTTGVNNQLTYSIVRLYNNYFAGSVTTSSYAGGAIGKNGLIATGQSVNGNRVKGSTSSVDEANVTYGNMIIASSITGNSSYTAAFAADDVSMSGRDNRIWDGTKLNGTYAALLQSDGDYLYDYWIATDKFPQQTKTLQLFKTTDLEDSDMYNSDTKMATMFYRNMGWSMSWKTTTNPNRNYQTRVSINGMQDDYEDSGYDTGNYLPQERSSATLRYSLDYNISQQNLIERLEIPQYTSPARTARASYSINDEEHPYGEIYASDADKINVEFSSNLVGTGYFVLKQGDKEIAREAITKRVYTYSYAFDKKLTLSYGEILDTALDDKNLLCADNLEEIGAKTVSHDELARNIMVYKDDYYYISDSGVVSGKSGTHSGDFVMLMNGKALSADGIVYSVTDWSACGTVVKTTQLEESQPLYTFDYDGYHINTYAQCSLIEQDRSAIYRNVQLYVSNGVMYSVPGTLENKKDSILIYNLNGVSYQTILGTDGIMVDMRQEDANIPEEVPNKAIVQMTDTLQASVPYVIVEYSNGGMIGYNYATGEILFDNSIAANTSLLDYAKQYISGVKDSINQGISSTYAPNADLSQKLHSSAELDKLVGNNSGELITDHSTGENTAEATDNTALADDTNTAVTNPDNIGVGGEAGGEAINGSNQAGVGAATAIMETGNGDAAVTDKTEAQTEAQTEVESALNKPEADDAQDGRDEQAAGDEQDTQSLADSDTQSNTTAEEANGTTDAGNSTEEHFMTVYNNETGMYEIVATSKYLSDESYQSENARLGITDLPKSSGYAVAQVDKSQKNGLAIYVMAAALIMLLIAGVLVYNRKKR